jgi:DNA-binding transcriptional regulator YhcF (GntR family)
MKIDNNLSQFDLKFNSLSSVPLYLQVKALLKEAILSERIEKGGRLPSIKRLSREVLLSAVTIERAYRQLEKEGYVLREKGFGYFVL